jgi:hypothetical protein
MVDEVETAGTYDWHKPSAVPVDLEALRQELEAAGWARLERLGKVVWRNPKSGRLYPQGAAISAVRRERLDD